MATYFLLNRRLRHRGRARALSESQTGCPPQINRQRAHGLAQIRPECRAKGLRHIAVGPILAAALAPTLNTLAKSKGSGSFFDAGAVPPNGQGLKGLRETVLADEGRRQVARLNQYLGALAAIASAAPLLGLLGTVVGMIEMFVAQAAGSSADPSALAGGIAVALYNTAFGLIVAIPALLLWRVLKSKVNALQLHMELEAARFLRFSPNETE